MNTIFDNEKIEYLKQHYANESSKDIAAALGLTIKQINQKARNLGIKKADDYRNYVIWNAQKIKYLKEHYPHIKTEHIAKHLNMSVNTCYNKAFDLGLKKTHEFLASPESGRDLAKYGTQYQFKKGHVPHNKGKAMPEQVYEKCKQTMFKKGDIPKNTKFDGALSVRNHNRENAQYVYVRVSKGVWQALHRVVYEKHFGKIPKNHKVIFKDGNRTNFDISNLQLVTDAEMMKINSIHRFPAELQLSIRMINKLQKLLNTLQND